MPPPLSILLLFPWLRSHTCLLWLVWRHRHQQTSVYLTKRRSTDLCKKGLPILSGDISQYSANEFARCNRQCAAFMTVCIPMWPQSNYYSRYLCPLRQRGRKASVLLPEKPFLETPVGCVHLFVFTPGAKSFYDRSFSWKGEWTRDLVEY